MLHLKFQYRNEHFPKTIAIDREIGKWQLYMHFWSTGVMCEQLNAGGKTYTNIS